MSRSARLRFQVIHKGGAHIDVAMHIDGKRVGNFEFTDEAFGLLWDALEASELVDVEVAILRPVRGHRGTWCWCNELGADPKETGDRVRPPGEEPEP